MQERKEIEKIPIVEAIELLLKEDINVGQEEAELIIEFLYNHDDSYFECFDVG